ncbi:MAG: hypothetical protein JWN48_589 [Myxococcaceae bacterium]|nr:hypothetical protein [Myxococcaceae bacterium]
MSRLPRVREQLLVLHRALLAAQRVGHEREHGRVGAGRFLELVVNAPEFAWLQPMTALIVALDEALETALRAPAAEAAELETAYLADARKLLRVDAEGSEFSRQYAQALHEAPDVLFEHGVMMRLLAGPA